MSLLVVRGDGIASVMLALRRRYNGSTLSEAPSNVSRREVITFAVAFRTATGRGAERDGEFHCDDVGVRHRPRPTPAGSPDACPGSVQGLPRAVAFLRLGVPAARAGVRAGIRCVPVVVEHGGLVERTIPGERALQL